MRRDAVRPPVPQSIRGLWTLRRFALGRELVEELERDSDRTLLVLRRKVPDVVPAVREGDVEDLAGPGVAAVTSPTGDEPVDDDCGPSRATEREAPGRLVSGGTCAARTRQRAGCVNSRGSSRISSAGSSHAL